jgi:transcriptional regulator with XRE-family HTH domain
MTIADRLKSLRLGFGLSVEELARRAGLGHTALTDGCPHFMQPG